jgi:hypothetical protein
MDDLGFLVPRGEQAHTYLWLRLSNSGDHQLQIAGSRLNTLRSQRNRCDYDLNLNFYQTGALVQIQVSAQIVQIIEGTKQVSARAQITDTMKSYERDILKVATWRR